MDTRSAGGHQVAWVLLFAPWMPPEPHRPRPTVGEPWPRRYINAVVHCLGKTAQDQPKYDPQLVPAIAGC